MRKRFFCTAFCALLLSGCWSGRSEQTVYDWEAPSPRADLLLRCRRFRNFSSADLALRYQKADGSVVVDPYRRWAQAPEFLLRSYLMNAFSGAKAGAGAAQIDCMIFEFRTDMAKGVCSLGVEYTLKTARSERTLVFRAEKPFDRKEPASVAGAFSAAAGEFVKAIASAAKQ